MWCFVLINLSISLHSDFVRATWVEIPQLTTSRKTTPFVFATPKVSFIEPTLTTPPNAEEITTDKTPKAQNENSGFLQVLQEIQESLTRNSKKSGSKISFLRNLQGNLLSNIDLTMSNVWKRNIKSEARGHDEHDMDFPSNEGALMTIAFLTFAVFLIKLVLKLIYALKEKQSASMVMMTTAAPVAFIGRKKRDIPTSDTINILKLIDDFNFE